MKNLKSAVSFTIQVTDGNKILDVDVDEELAKNIPLDRVIGIDEALAMGLDIQKDNPLISEDEILRYRRMNAQKQGEIIKGDDGIELIPVLESLRERTKHTNLLPAICFYEEAYNSTETIVSESVHLPENTFDQEQLPNVNEIYPVNGVFIPSSDSNEKFLKNLPMSGGNDFPSAKFAEKIVSICKLYRYRGSMFEFKREKGYYEKLTSNELLVLIDTIAGNDIREANKAKAYAEIEKFLRYDYRLEVNENNVMPPNYWVFKNGILDVFSGGFSVNDGRFFVESAILCQYYQGAVCPVFDTFLEAVSGNDDQFIEFLWQFIGYILSPDNCAKVFFAFVGPKDTGKSLFANILTKFFPDTAISLLGANDFSGRFDVAEIKGKRLNLCMDLPDNPLSTGAVGKIKTLTGGDTVRSDVKFKDSVSFRNTAKILFGSNSLLRTEIPDLAFNDRLITIPFRNPIPKEKQDKGLEEKITQELSGIATRAIQAYLRLRNNNFIFPEVELPEDFGKVFDYDKVVMSFVGEMCVFERSAKTSTEQLYKMFTEFCQMKKVNFIEKNDFSTRFNSLFGENVTKKKIKFGDSSLQGYIGVKIKEGE